VRARERRRDHLAEGIRCERELVRVLLHRRDYVEHAAEKIEFDRFQDVVYRRIFTELATLGPDASLGELTATLDEDAIEEIQGLLDDKGGLDFPRETIEGCLNKMAQRDDALRLAELDRLIPLASEEQKADLIAEKQTLHQRMIGAPQKRWKQFPFPSR
jgi:hypothetical protein